jgi:hypothetical protein
MTDEFDEVLDGEAQELANGGSERAMLPPALPTLAEVRTLAPSGGTAVPAVQAAALAATGIVVGAAAAALVRRHGGRKSARRGRLMRRRSPEGLPVISTHTYLVRVQVLGRPAE